MLRALISFFILFISLSFTQAPDTLWTKSYGGTNSDWAESSDCTLDNGYIVVGTTYSFGNGNCNVYILKINSFGDTLWTRTFGGDSFDDGRDIYHTSDSNYIIVGGTHSYGNGDQINLIKIDQGGNSIWQKRIGGSLDERGYSVRQTFDNGYIISGFTVSSNNPTLYIVKTNSVGDTIWTRTYGPGKGYAIQQTIDSGYIIAGPGIIKIDSAGSGQWIYNCIGGEFFSIQQTQDSGYIAVGYIGGYPEDVHLVKLSANGDSVWGKRYGGSIDDRGLDVKQSLDGGYIISGYSHSFGSHVYLIKTHSNGDTVWTTTIGNSSFDDGTTILQNPDRGYFIAGFNNDFGDVYLIKTRPDTLSIIENAIHSIKNNRFTSSILNGPLILPKNKKYRIFDITGRTVSSNIMNPGIYYIEFDGLILQKVVKIR